MEKCNWKLVGFVVVLYFLIGFCCAVPIDYNNPHADYDRRFLATVLGVSLFACGSFFLLGCLWCTSKKGFKVFHNNPVVASSSTSLDRGYVNPVGNEFTIFTPLSPPLQNNNIFLANEQIIGRTEIDCSHASIDVRPWFGPHERDFPRTKLKYIKEFGKGWFGRVVQGIAQTDDSEKPQWTTVIVRILEASATSSERAVFLHDAIIYRCGDHPNILQLLGRSLESVPLLLMQEFCPLGDLKRYLLDNRSEKLLAGDLPLKWCCQLASAVKHLHEHKLTHFDIAARNCQITSNCDLKLGDYGLGASLYPDDYYQGSPAIPIRWCAPESISYMGDTIEVKPISSEGNIWSLGVTMWEIYECGAQPYEQLNDADVLTQVFSSPNLRLSRPRFSVLYTDYIFRLMQLCWSTYESRPSIIQIHLMLMELMQIYEHTKNVTSSDSLLSMEDFDKRWDTLKPNTPKIDNHDFSENVSMTDINLSDITILNMNLDKDDLSSSKPMSPSLNNLHGSLDNLTGGEMDSWLEKVATKTGDMSYVQGLSQAIKDLDNALALENVSSSDSSPAPEGLPKSKLQFILGPTASYSNTLHGGLTDSTQRTSSESETEDENWRRKVEHGVYSEKVNQKSKSVTDLMVLTHIDCSESDSETPLPSLDYRINYKNVRCAQKNLENMNLMYGSEGNLLSVHDKFQEELKRLQEERKDSLLFVPESISHTEKKSDNSFILDKASSSSDEDTPTIQECKYVNRDLLANSTRSPLANRSINLRKSESLIEELSSPTEIQPSNQVYNVFNVTIDAAFSPVHRPKLDISCVKEKIEDISPTNEIKTKENVKVINCIKENATEKIDFVEEKRAVDKFPINDYAIDGRENILEDTISIVESTTELSNQTKLDTTESTVEDIDQNNKNSTENNNEINEKVNGTGESTFKNGTNVFESTREFIDQMKKDLMDDYRTATITIEGNHLEENGAKHNGNVSKPNEENNRNNRVEVEQENRIRQIAGNKSPIIENILDVTGIQENVVEDVKVEKHDTESINKLKEGSVNVQNENNPVDVNDTQEDPFEVTLKTDESTAEGTGQTEEDMSQNVNFEESEDDILEDESTSKEKNATVDGNCVVGCSPESIVEPVRPSQGSTSENISVDQNKESTTDDSHYHGSTSSNATEEYESAENHFEVPKLMDIIQNNDFLMDFIIATYDTQEDPNERPESEDVEEETQPSQPFEAELPFVTPEVPGSSDANNALSQQENINQRLETAENRLTLEAAAGLILTEEDINQLLDDEPTGQQERRTGATYIEIIREPTMCVHDILVLSKELRSTTKNFDQIKQPLSHRNDDDDDPDDFRNKQNTSEENVGADQNTSNQSPLQFDVSDLQEQMTSIITSTPFTKRRASIEDTENVKEALQFSSNFNDLSDDEIKSELTYSLETWDNFLDEALNNPTRKYDNFSSEPHSLVFSADNKISNVPLTQDEALTKRESCGRIQEKEENVLSDKTFVCDKEPSINEKMCNATFIAEEAKASNETYTKDEEQNKTFEVKEKPLNKTYNKEDEGNWESKEGWYLHANDSEVSGRMEIAQKEDSYVGFSMDDEIMTAIRNELLQKLPQAQGPSEQVRDSDDWDAEGRSEVVIRYNVYTTPLSPIPEESYSENDSNFICNREESSDSEDWPEPYVEPNQEPEPHRNEESLAGATQNGRSQDSCGSNDTLYNLEELTTMDGFKQAEHSKKFSKESDSSKSNIQKRPLEILFNVIQGGASNVVANGGFHEEPEKQHEETAKAVDAQEEINTEVENVMKTPSNLSYVVEDSKAIASSSKEEVSSFLQPVSDAPKTCVQLSASTEANTQERNFAEVLSKKLNDLVNRTTLLNGESNLHSTKKGEDSETYKQDDEVCKAKIAQSIENVEKEALLFQTYLATVQHHSMNSFDRTFFAEKLQDRTEKECEECIKKLNMKNMQNGSVEWMNENDLNILNLNHNKLKNRRESDNYITEFLNNERQNSIDSIEDLKSSEDDYVNIYQNGDYVNCDATTKDHDYVNVPCSATEDGHYVNISDLTVGNGEILSYMDLEAKPSEDLYDHLYDPVANDDVDIYDALADIRFTGPTDMQLMSTSFSESADVDDQDWDSGSDTRSSSSGEFIWKEGEHEESVKALRAAPQDLTSSEKIDRLDEIEEVSTESSEEEEEGDGPEFVPSAWDKYAMPSKSALRSPEKTLEKSEVQHKKSKGVWFKKQKYHCVYEYPREPESPNITNFEQWQPVAQSLMDWQGEAKRVPDFMGLEQNPYMEFENKDLCPDFNSAGIDDEFYISSTTRPFECFGGFSSQFFPGHDMESWSCLTKPPSDNATPDSGMEDTTPSTMSDDLPLQKPCCQVQSLKILAAITLRQSQVNDCKSLSGTGSLGDMRHTRNKLKLDLPPSPSAFTVSNQYDWKSPAFPHKDLVINPPEETVKSEVPTFTTFGKSRFQVQHVDTPPSDEPANKNVSFEALPYKPMLKIESKAQIEVRGEASLLDSADEDSGIESSTLERKKAHL